MNEIGKVSIKLIADTDSFFKDIKKAVASISKIKDAEIKITADTSQLKKSISSSISEISKIKNANILIGSDITKLTKGVDVAKSQIEQISKTSASIPLNVDNVKALDKVQQTEARLKILQQRANEISINPSVKTSALQGLELQIGSTKDRLNTLDPSFLSASFSRFGGVAKSALNGLLDSAKTLSLTLAGLTLGAGILGTNKIFSAVNAFGDLQAQTGLLQGQLKLTADEMTRLKQTSIDLGNDLTLPGVSAVDATEAIKQLTLNGITLNDSLTASKSVLQLAKIANIDFGESARYVATQLNTFGLSGDKASDIANRLAKSSTAGGVTISEFGYAVNQVGLVSKQAGLNFDELSNLLAVFSKNGLRGSDAGTSLKTALLRLIAPSGSALDVIDNLNLEFFDANKNIKPLPQLVGELQRGFKGLSQEAKLGALNELFGSDAIRAGTILLDEGIDGINRMEDRINSLGSADEQLAGLTSGFKGIKEAIGSTLETADIQIGEAIEPIFTRIGKKMSDILGKVDFGLVGQGISEVLADINIEGFFETIGTGIKSFFQGVDTGESTFNKILSSLSNLVKGVQVGFGIIGEVLGKVVNSVGGLENFNNILLITASAIGAVSIAMGVLNVVSSPVTLTVLAIAGAVSGLAFILGNGDITKGISVIKDGLANAFSRVLPFVQALGKGISELWNTLAENAIVKDVIASFGSIFENLIGIVQQVITIVGFMWNEMKLGEFIINTLKIAFVLIGTTVYGVIKIVQGLVATIKQVIDFGGGILEFFGIKAPKEVKKFENQVDSSTESIFGDLKSIDGFDFDVKQVKIENNSKSTQSDLNLVNRFKLDTKPLQISTNSNEAIQQVQSVNNTNIASKFVAITTQSQQAINEIVAVNNTSLQSKTLSIGVANNASPVINEVSGAIRSIPDKTVSLVTKGSQSQVSQEVANIVSYANTALQSRPVVIKTQIQSVASQISSAIRSVPGQSLGGLIKPFASGGKVQSLLGGGLASLIPKGDDTIAGYKFGEFVSKVPVSRKYGGVLNSMNFETPKFDGFMQNVARMTKAIGAMASSNTTNNTNNLPVNINIANLNQQGTSRAVAGIGFMLQSEMLNRGLL